LLEHESGRLGAKYLRGRGPLTLVFQLIVGDRSRATRVEHHIKRLSKRKKEAFIKSPGDFRRHIQTLAKP
jgi:putative endonuclease